MKAEDLMIGDLVKFPCGIDKVCDLLYVEGKGICASFAASATLFPVPVGALEPIPLTPEILEKNGFAKRFDDDLVLMECESIVMEIGNNYTRFKDGKMFLHRVLTPLYYVHELQHALRLCKIEKEIEI